MSFILDALKKSENERQQKTPAEFATVPRAPVSARAPRWLWVLGGLLAVNIALVGLALLKKSRPAPAQTSAMGAERVAAPDTAAADFSARLERARLAQPAPARTDPVPESAGGMPQDTTLRDAAPPVATPRPESNFALLPGLNELRANGTSQLPDLHVDIHVFSDVPSDRFVFINMNKYRERDRIAEGPVVREITRDGVILDHDGTAFVLLRD